MLKCNVGGGVRSAKLAKEAIEAGANSVIIGTRANREFLTELPRNKSIVVLDTKNGKIATHGWSKLKEGNIYEKMHELEDYCYKFLITNINVEGLNKRRKNKRGEVENARICNTFSSW